MSDLYSEQFFSSSREAPPQYLGTLKIAHILTSQLETETQTKKHVTSMIAHAREYVASWLRQEQPLEHNMPSTKHISFLDPLLAHSDDTTQHSTRQYNPGHTQTRHTSILVPPAHTPKCFARAALYKENSRTSRAAGRNARTMARRCIRPACSI